MVSNQHFIQYVPSRRSFLGGGTPGYIICSCGWTHTAVDNRTARKLTALHIDGELR